VLRGSPAVRQDRSAAQQPGGAAARRRGGPAVQWRGGPRASRGERRCKAPRASRRSGGVRLRRAPRWVATFVFFSFFYIFFMQTFSSIFFILDAKYFSTIFVQFFSSK